MGRTGLKVGCLSIAWGYGARTILPGARSSSAKMPRIRQALKNIVAKGRRNSLVLAAFTHAHNDFFTGCLLRRGLKGMGG
jgi:hypothetical protein